MTFNSNELKYSVGILINDTFWIRNITFNIKYNSFEVS